MTFSVLTAKIVRKYEIEVNFVRFVSAVGLPDPTMPNVHNVEHNAQLTTKRVEDICAVRDTYF